jgi:hypothetical protein
VGHASNTICREMRIKEECESMLQDWGREAFSSGYRVLKKWGIGFWCEAFSHGIYLLICTGVVAIFSLQTSS